MESFGELGELLYFLFEWKDDMNICLQHINDPGWRTALELGR